MNHPLNRQAELPDCVVVGGGVVGLSIAHRLAGGGARVTLVERGQPGREASWAGAGILPAASWYSDHPALDRMAVRASRMHEELSTSLRSATGIDDEYARCGAIYYESEANAAYLAAAFARWQALGVEVERVEPPKAFKGAWSVPAEAQVRNPRRLRALLAACRLLGVRVLAGCDTLGFTLDDDRVLSLLTTEGPLQAGHFIVAAGCWTPAVLAQAGIATAGRPIRGQMLLLRGETAGTGTIIHDYPYYLVPRRDGHVLVGATVEDVGFDRSTTNEAKRELIDAALRMAPGVVQRSRVVGFWAGLRPGGAGELPQIGRAPGFSNLWMASGHHRAGLQLAPPTAELIYQQIVGEISDDAEAFAPSPTMSGGRLDDAVCSG